MARSDRRVQYTKQTIKDSLFELMTAMPFEQITVKALCEKADINRATFYSHYETMDSLLEEIELEKSNELFERLDGIMTDEDHLRSALVRVVRYLKQHSALREIFLNRSIAGKGLSHLLHTHQQHTIEFMVSAGHMAPIQAELIFTFIISGIKEVLKKWFDDGMKDEKQMIETMVKFILVGLNGFKEQ